MGCGASNDVANGVANSVQNSTNNTAVQNTGGPNNNASQAKLFPKLNNSNTNLNKTPQQNQMGFKKVDIDYSDDYYKNTGEKSLTNGNVTSKSRNNDEYMKSSRSFERQQTYEKIERESKFQNEKSSRINSPIPAPINNSKTPNKDALAFTITFDDTKNTNVENILKRAPPARFKLEPLNVKPKLTQEQLDEKMKAAEQKREEILAKRIKSSKASSERKEVIQRHVLQQDFEKTKYQRRTTDEYGETIETEIDRDRNFNEEPDAW